MCKYKWVLASASPRRKEILSSLLDTFEIRVSEADESFNETDPKEIVKEIAAHKGMAVLKNVEEGEIVIAADTLVFVDKRILGKPADINEAREMIRMISGREHYVASGVFVGIKKEGKYEYDCFSEISTVYTDALTEEEIENYINTKEPYDKAGGYAIQGLFGKHIKGIKGDYYNIVGFPLNAFYNYCKNKGYL